MSLSVCLSRASWELGNPHDPWSLSEHNVQTVRTEVTFGTLLQQKEKTSNHIIATWVRSCQISVMRSSLAALPTFTDLIVTGGQYGLQLTVTLEPGSWFLTLKVKLKQCVYLYFLYFK